MFSVPEDAAITDEWCFYRGDVVDSQKLKPTRWSPSVFMVYPLIGLG